MIIIELKRLLILLYLICNAYGWMWTCKNNTNCVRTKEQTTSTYPSIDTCKLVCGDYRSLWPRPNGHVRLAYDLELVNYSDLEFVLAGSGKAQSYLQKLTEYFRDLINLNKVKCSDQYKQLRIVLAPVSFDTTLNLETVESYTLKIQTTGNIVEVNIQGPTVFGVRHGLETFSQLITTFSNGDDNVCLVTLKDGEIKDEPVYPHRGLLIDTARNYQTVDTIKRHIDAMAASKLNVLHWHITDSQSFPLVSSRMPNMTKYGAYSNEQVYSQEAVEDLMQYALIRGVRVVLELDAPAHIGSGWQWGPEAGLGNLGVCIFQQPWRSYCIQPPCGQLNPTNPNVYSVLQELYKDFIEFNPTADFFHMGGDELFIPCWNASKEITKSMPGRTEKDFLDLWAYFQKRALNNYDIAKGNNKTNVIVWTSHLTNPAYIKKYLPHERYVIQTWVPSDDNLPKQLLNLGYRLIISTKNKWYLDHGFWGNTNYYNWRSVYNNRILKEKGVLGGEVCMWGELVDTHNVLTRTWPRAAAAGERLWANPDDTSLQAENRFFTHRDRLLFRKINAEAVVPRWCSQNEGECSMYLSYYN